MVTGSRWEAGQIRLVPVEAAIHGLAVYPAVHIDVLHFVPVAVQAERQPAVGVSPAGSGNPHFEFTVAVLA